MNRAPVPAFKRSSVQAFCSLLPGVIMMTARALAADYTVATAPANFVIKAPAEWTKVQCHVVHDKIIVLAAGDALFDGNGRAKNATFTVVVSPIAPYSLTSPSPPAPLAPGATGGQATVTYKGSEQASLVESFEFKKPEGGTSIRLYVVPVKLQSIGFGNTIGDLQRDDGTTYESPQWQDGNHDNVVLAGSADPGEDADRNYPVGFVRNTKPKLTDKTVVKLGGPLPDGITLYLTAISQKPGLWLVARPMLVNQTGGSYQGTLKDGPVESGTMVSDEIRAYDSGASAEDDIYRVGWFASVGGGGVALQLTQHTFYQTAALPKLSQYGLRESMVYYACHGAEGADPDSPTTIAIAIHDRIFKHKNMFSVHPARAKMDTGSHVLEYSGNQPHRPDPLPPGYLPNYLPQEKSGMCGTWGRFMRNLNWIHGSIDAVAINVVPNPDARNEGLGFKPTAFLAAKRLVPPASGQANEPTILKADGITPGDVPDLLPGQGNPTPPSPSTEWGYHCIAGFRSGTGFGTLFDPSYGEGVFQDQPSFEAYLQVFKGTKLQVGPWFWPDQSTVTEVVLTEAP